MTLHIDYIFLLQNQLFHVMKRQKINGFEKIEMKNYCYISIHAWS